MHRLLRPVVRQLSAAVASAQSGLPDGVRVLYDFVTEDEESWLLKDCEKTLKRLRYETEHWDDAIHGYRETEKSNWHDPRCLDLISRIRSTAFPPTAQHLGQVHILDLSAEGHIKPHVDSTRFVGNTIAGLCLLSAAVMRLETSPDAREAEPDKPVLVSDILLPRRCLYVLSGYARYSMTHAVLRHTESFHEGRHIPRERRISVICRSEPTSSE